MKKTLALTIVILCIGIAGFNYIIEKINKKPLIRATSKIVDIRDGEKLKKNEWTIVPTKRPDIYITFENKVTFYTNLDSISFNVALNNRFQFVILLNNKDSAFTEIVHIPKYIETLKKASRYNNKDCRLIPKFRYQSSNNPNLISLKVKYGLDSIAGSGDEFSKVKNVLAWVHNLIPHDQNLPNIRNAESLIADCKKNKRGLNCRGLAITLNECYLSLGFKSRYITCMPKDSFKMDNDCHVINMVYLNSLNKWIWLDPTNNAYVMNENGIPLSIEEVRERIIENQPLIINTEANYNHRNSVVKEEYLFNYMAKNLYIMECPVYSQYNLESPRQIQVPDSPENYEYIKLLPLDYYIQTPNKTGQFYITNNSTLFWAKP